MAKIGNFLTTLNLFLLSKTCSDAYEPYMILNPRNEEKLNPGGASDISMFSGVMIGFVSSTWSKYAYFCNIYSCQSLPQAHLVCTTWI